VGSAELGELLVYIIGRCGHEPPANEDGPAVCEECENVLVVVLIDRVTEDEDILH
jgi:hypothetical protein